MLCRYASVVPCLFLCWFIRVPVWRYKETFFFLKVSEVCLIFLQVSLDGMATDFMLWVGVPGFGNKALSNEIRLQRVCGFTLRRMFFRSAPNEKSFSGE